MADSGISVVAAADIDATAIETHEANIGGLAFAGDLSDPTDFLDFLDTRGVKRVDIVAGGPPCQPFSRAAGAKIRSLIESGVRDPIDQRVDLWESFVEVVQTLSPQLVLLENVPDMASWNDGAVLLGVLQSLRELGYAADAQMLQAHRFGVPQHRTRLFVVGHRRGAFRWPRARPRVDVIDAIGDLPAVGPGHRHAVTPYEGPKTAFQRRARRRVPKSDRAFVYDHVTRAARRDDAEAFRRLKPGQTYRDLPKRLRRYRDDIFDDKYKRLRWEDLSRTITAHIARDAYWYIHPEQPRTLSIREAARLQTFPDWFRFAGHPTTQLRQIGNAVPPALAMALGRSAVAALQTRGKPRQSNFAPRLLSWHVANARAFPWREERDPWLVLLAEMCLRRTRADVVDQIYERLIAVAPSPAAVISDPDRIRQTLEPLGLRWRTENLIRMAAELLERHAGAVPSSEAELRALTGVGDYVASAVRCFAFDARTVLVDTNTRRIVERVSGREASSAWTTRLEMYRLSGEAGPTAAFNYAMLDLGGRVCHANDPSCNACPVRRECRHGA